ncbi:alpha/beta fold hydrolase [Nereida sp. MMG025]|uniref:alpha/beta fold hydrolase n=1 Tax=Nereida sp. MMG025 TaxID=2909981 RepID=UPI001F2666B1|nr:alpha/beta hydrolase [Nereida sp. MMG025]MCF6445164.1 alpha/beta hydrolase [Nereida sp. MMG025]
MQNAPFDSAAADGPDAGAAYWITADDGVRLRIAHWQKGARGTVLLFPGRTEYVEKYGRAARSLLARGYGTITIDWRGQGLADRLLDDRNKGHVEKFSDYQRDVLAMVEAATDLGLPRPYYMIGHSMGGCIGLRALMEELDVNAAAFSAPMWGILMSPALRPIAWGLTTIARPLQFADLYAPGTKPDPYIMVAPFEDNTLSRDKDMVDYMRQHLIDQPDLALGGPTMHWLNEALIEMRSLAAKKSPDVPTLCGLGDNERIVDPARVHDRMARWPNGELKVFTNCEHELMMEVATTREGYLSACADLFDANG